MARITVEDCLDKVENRFDLVLLATKRARQIVNGVDPMIETENDKPTVIALREIADGIVTTETMEEVEKQQQESIDEELAAALQAEDFDLADMADDEREPE